MISLNWINYTAGAAPGSAPLWALAVSRWILFLPLFSTSAAFPLYCAVLVGNLAETLGPASVPMSARGRGFLSIACALPAIILTWCVHDTALIFSLAGLSAFFIVFFFPAFLQERGHYDPDPSCQAAFTPQVTQKRRSCSLPEPLSRSVRLRRLPPRAAVSHDGVRSDGALR